MNIKNVYILDDRAILYINGEDAKEFLQNLISNDINKVSDVNSCFSSLLKLRISTLDLNLYRDNCLNNSSA